MHFQAKHADFAAKLAFFLILGGLVWIAYEAGGVDFRGYYGAAKLITRGGNPYDYSQLAPVLEETTGYAGNNPYFYPPWFALFFIPLTLLPFETARLLWLILNAVLLFGGLHFVREALEWRAAGWRKWTVCLAGTLLFGAYCLRSEQAGIALLFFLGVTLVSVKQRRPALAGLALILFASKPQITAPAAIVIALWSLRSGRRTVGWAALWTVALTVVSSIVIRAWWQFDQGDFGAGLAYELDGPARVAAERVLSTVYDFSRYVLGIRPPQQYMLVLAIAFFGLLLVVQAWRQSTGLSQTVAATLILTLLLTPYALQYDYVLLVLPLLWTIMRLPLLGPAYRWTVRALLALTLAVLLWQQWSYQGYLQLLTLAAAFAVTQYAVGRQPTVSELAHEPSSVQ